MKSILVAICGLISTLLLVSCSSPVTIRSPKHKSSNTGPAMIRLSFSDDFDEVRTLTINDEVITLPASCVPVASGECTWIAPPLSLSGNTYTDAGESFKYKLTVVGVRDNGGSRGRSAFFNAASLKWGAPLELYSGPGLPTGSQGSGGGGSSSVPPVSVTSRGFDQLGTTTTTTAVYVNEPYQVDVSIRIESSTDFALLSSTISSNRSRAIDVTLPAGGNRVIFYLHTERQPNSYNRFFELKARAPGYIEKSISGRVASSN